MAGSWIYRNWLCTAGLRGKCLGRCANVGWVGAVLPFVECSASQQDVSWPLATTSQSQSGLGLFRCWTFPSDGHCRKPVGNQLASRQRRCRVALDCASRCNGDIPGVEKGSALVTCFLHERRSTASSKPWSGSAGRCGRGLESHRIPPPKLRPFGMAGGDAPKRKTGVSPVIPDSRDGYLPFSD